MFCASLWDNLPYSILFHPLKANLCNMDVVAGKRKI